MQLLSNYPSLFSDDDFEDKSSSDNEEIENEPNENGTQSPQSEGKYS